MVLLVGGHVRSGTSMLRDICNGHPDLVMTHEFAAFLGIGKPYTDYQQRMLQAWKRKSHLRYNIFRYPGVARNWWRTGYAAVRGHLFTARFLLKMRKYHQEQIEVSLVEAVYRDLFPKVKLVGDKWPDYVFYLDKFAEHEDVLPVMISRDCRDVASSTLKLVRTNWRNQAWTKNVNTVGKIAQRWLSITELIERNRDKVHCIRYEDLVRNPEQELKVLGKWLGIDPGGFPVKFIRDNRVSKYKNGLTTDEVEEIIHVAGPTMARLGYL